MLLAEKKTATGMQGRQRRARGSTAEVLLEEKSPGFGVKWGEASAFALHIRCKSRTVM